MWLNRSLPQSSLSALLNQQPFRQNVTSPAASLALTTQQQALITRSLHDNSLHKERMMELSDKQILRASGVHRPLTRTVSCGFAAQQNNGNSRHSALNHHRALQRSSSYDVRGGSNVTANITQPGSPPSNTKNGYRSRETGVVEKLLLSYGFIKCADREGRLFFHYSQFHGEAHQLHINDEVEFEVSMDTRTGKPVAVQVVKLKKGTVVFEVFSEERILGEVTSPAAPQSGTVPGMQPTEKGEVLSSPQGSKYGSLSYERNGEFFFLPYTVNDLTNKSILLYPGDKVSFYIATEKRTGVLRARKITLVERAPPKRFAGIVTAMKESFGFIERADIVKEIFFHYSEVSPNVPDLHVGDHVEFSVHERNSKEVATEVRLLPLGSVLMEHISNEMYVGTVEKPLPPKPSNKLQAQQTIAGGDATSPSVNTSTNGSATVPSQPVLALAGSINYTTEQGESRKIRFGEKDRASNCLYTLCKGDQVSFLTVTDKRNGQQRAAGVRLMLEETLALSGEKREMGIVAAVKEGFGFIKCLERDSRLFFHCCELLDPAHHIRMSDEVEFTVLQDPIAEKYRLHATRIRVLAKGTVIFHAVSEDYYRGAVVSLPGSTVPVSPAECLISPALGPNPGFILYDHNKNAKGDSPEERKIPFLAKDFAEWMEASTLKIGDEVTFRVCMVKRTGAQNAVDIRKTNLAVTRQRSNAAEVIRNIISNLSLIDPATSPTSESDAAPASPVNTSLSTPRISMQSSPQKIIPAIEDTAIPAPLFKLDPVPKSQVMRKVSAPSTPNKLTRSPSNNVTSPNKNKKVSIATDSVEKCHGWISTIKETFGFIEYVDHKSEIFFHFSELCGPVEKFTVGTAVTFITGNKDEKPCALQVSVVEAGSDKVQEAKHIGVVTRVLKSANSDSKSESNYQGKIQYKPNEDHDEMHEISYTPVSLSDRREFLQVGDNVTFQVSVKGDNLHAVNVSAKRQLIQAAVESVRGDYGFILHEIEGNGKLFFHMSEVRNGSKHIQSGAIVEFSVVCNQRTGKYSAANIRCVQSKRPERLRMRSEGCRASATMTITRQPKGPADNEKGFTLERKVQLEA